MWLWKARSLQPPTVPLPARRLVIFLSILVFLAAIAFISSAFVGPTGQIEGRRTRSSGWRTTSPFPGGPDLQRSALPGEVILSSDNALEAPLAHKATNADAKFSFKLKPGSYRVLGEEGSGCVADPVKVRRWHTSKVELICER